MPSRDEGAPGGWRLELLGQFCLWRGGATVALSGTGQRLVAYLALRGPADRPQAAGTLWCEKADARAQADLRTAVWRLRSAAPGLLAGESRLALAPEVAVDTRVILGPDRVHPDDLPFQPGSRLPELLSGWCDDWVLLERERVRHRLLRILETSADDAIRHGNLKQALGWALASVSADPLRESAHRLVVRAQLADGNVEAARRQAALIERRLRDELGVRPSDHLLDLIRSL